ncbi:MAG TPA: metallophosphoesterase [Chthoniobacterales bacterium]|nr:metallophosphoesterase [Chthoniobacterales bacterium]
MKMLFVADLHYTLKQFDWLLAHATDYDPIIIGGDLLDLGSVLDADTQIMVVEKYLYRLRQRTRVVVCSGNHDLDSCNPAGEAVAGWLHDVKAANLFLDGTNVELSGAFLTICPWWDADLSRPSRSRVRVTIRADQKTLDLGLSCAAGRFSGLLERQEICG